VGYTTASLEVGACCGAPPRCRYPYLSGDFLHRADDGHMRVVVWGSLCVYTGYLD